MKVELKGVTELRVQLEKNMKLDLVKQIVRTNGSELNSKMVRNAVFTRGYSTGATRRSISLMFDQGGMTARVKPGTEYSPYVEYGTRFMSAQPFVRPSFDAQKNIFVSDLEELVR